VHVLRNASIPIITDVMSNLPALLIGAFLIERFFGIPGIGREVIIAVERSDFPVIKAITVYIAAATMIFNLIADLVYKVVDPRVQLKEVGYAERSIKKKTTNKSRSSFIWPVETCHASSSGRQDRNVIASDCIALFYYLDSINDGRDCI